MSKKERQDQRSEESEEPKKERKVKVIYYDDGSTVADMSGTRGGKRPDKLKSTFREKMKTFFAVMKKMVLPLLCTLIGFTLVYILMLLIAGRL